jgi:hypothetical protein
VYRVLIPLGTPKREAYSAKTKAYSAPDKCTNAGNPIVTTKRYHSNLPLPVFTQNFPRK